MSPSNESRRRALLIVNASGLTAAGVFAAVGFARPSYPRRGATANPPTGFWSASSALRTWAITGPLLADILRGRRPAPALLVAAGLVQLGDSALGVRERNPRMAVLPAAMGLVHLWSARTVASAEL